MENEIAAIEKQLDYIEKRATKNVHEITVTRFDLWTLKNTRKER